MPDPAKAREENFERAIEDWDEKALAKAVNFAEHRFISIERDAVTGNRYVKGHKKMREACEHMASTVEEGETFVPEYLLDLDTGERHELDLFAFVTPRSVDAVALILPRQVAQAGDSRALDKALAQALERKRG